MLASIDITNPREQSIEFAERTLGVLRKIFWESFQSIGSLRIAADQILPECGYRRAYFTHTIDFDQNPVPSSTLHLYYAELGEPRGPGFICLDEPVIDNNYHCLVWSQAISFPNRTSLEQDQVKITERIQKVKWHWNAYDEIKNAERYVNQGDVKGAVRSAASAVDACTRSFAGLCEIEFPPKGNLPFNEKIEKVLEDADRPSYQDINPKSSKSLLKLYRARNSMHTGDRCYINPDTEKLVIVDAPTAREFVIEAKNFFIWLSGLA